MSVTRFKFKTFIECLVWSILTHVFCQINPSGLLDQPGHPTFHLIIVNIWDAAIIHKKHKPAWPARAFHLYRYAQTNHISIRFHLFSWLYFPLYVMSLVQIAALQMFLFLVSSLVTPATSMSSLMKSVHLLFLPPFCFLPFLQSHHFSPQTSLLCTYDIPTITVLPSTACPWNHLPPSSFL